jgi:hypothetical protein
MTTRTRLLTGALLAGLLVPTAALAGNLQVRDPGDVLPAMEETNLREAARAWPFDARVVVSSEMTSRADFDRYVGAQVASANMVVVGVDPTHRFTSVHFGTGTRIARERFSAIENAGDGWFRQGQWRGGIEAILSSANSAVGSGSPGTRADGPVGNTNDSAPSFPWGLMLLGLGGVAIAVMVFRAARNRAQMGPMGPGADPYRAQQYPPGYNPNGPGAYGPGYGPGYGPQPGGMGGLGAGILGAGVGGLAGYALGSHMANRDESHGSPGGFGSSSDDSGGSSFDAGGSSSGWDDGGGGGGGDFGGGGGDAGGGGGDW